MRALQALGRYARRPRAMPRDEACELCAAPTGERHPHVFDLQARAVRCACATCALLFVHPGARARYRTIPDRVEVDPALRLTPAQWDALQIPVGLAFVRYSSAARRWIAVYPSPAGPIESELPLEAWSELAASSPLVRSTEPDVEALLVRGERGAAELECLLAPIDACYELVGRIRTRWRGFDGGDAVRAEVAAFFEALRSRARARAGPRAGGVP